MSNIKKLVENLLKEDKPPYLKDEFKQLIPKGASYRDFGSGEGKKDDSKTYKISYNNKDDVQERNIFIDFYRGSFIVGCAIHGKSSIWPLGEYKYSKFKKVMDFITSNSNKVMDYSDFTQLEK